MFLDNSALIFAKLSFIFLQNGSSDRFFLETDLLLKIVAFTFCKVKYKFSIDFF